LVAIPQVVFVVLASVAGCLPVASVAVSVAACLLAASVVQGDNLSVRGLKVPPLSVHVALISKFGSIH